MKDLINLPLMPYALVSWKYSASYQEYSSAVALIIYYCLIILYFPL